MPIRHPDEAPMSALCLDDWEHAQIEHVRATLWAIKSIVESDGLHAALTRTLLFEVKTLAELGVRLCDQFIEL